LPAIASTLGVLEAFLRESLNAAGGVWDEVEPQVYDVLWPDADEPVRLTFDPEALPEHPGGCGEPFGCHAHGPRPVGLVSGGEAEDEQQGRRKPNAGRVG